MYVRTSYVRMYVRMLAELQVTPSNRFDSKFFWVFGLPQGRSRSPSFFEIPNRLVSSRHFVAHVILMGLKKSFEFWKFFLRKWIEG